MKKSFRSLSLSILATSLLVTGSVLGQETDSEPALFFTDRGTSRVLTSSIEGKELKQLARFDFANLRGIVADVDNGKVYFADNGSDKIYVVNTDGSGLKAIVGGLGFPADLTMDRKAKKLYWCDQQKNSISRCDLDGSNVETVIETLQPYYLDIDSKMVTCIGALSSNRGASTAAKSLAAKSTHSSRLPPPALFRFVPSNSCRRRTKRCCIGSIARHTRSNGAP